MLHCYDEKKPSYYHVLLSWNHEVLAFRFLRPAIFIHFIYKSLRTDLFKVTAVAMAAAISVGRVLRLFYMYINCFSTFFFLPVHWVSRTIDLMLRLFYAYIN